MKCLECGIKMIIDGWISPEWDGLCSDCKIRIQEAKESLKDWDYIDESEQFRR